MFLSLASDDSFHHVSMASLASLSNAYVTPLTCERVYFSVDRGICLNSEAQGTATAWFADVFDGSFQRLFRLPLAGTPSRVRLSPDGRRAAATMFESGHAYDEHGFSTRTTIIDTLSGKSQGDLEQFAVFRDGQQRNHSIDKKISMSGNVTHPINGFTLCQSNRFQRWVEMLILPIS